MERTNTLLLGSGSPATRLADNLDVPLLDLDREDLGAALSEALQQPVDLLLIVIASDASLQARAFETLGDDEWRAGVDQPLETLLRAFQLLGEQCGERPPPIVVAGPSMAFSGGDELAMLAASSEGQRALMKATARQWGSRGYRFTWVAVDTLLLLPELEGAPLPRAQDPEPVATGTKPAAADLSALLSLLADPRGAVVTGQSLILDGGELMLP